MEVRLKVLVGSSVGQELRIPPPKFFVGRAEDCQLRPRSDLVSRHHCVVIVEDPYVAVRDFGSKNGTLVNGERVAGERELLAGDNLKIGPLEFEVVILKSAAAKKRPKVDSLQEAAARTAEATNSTAEIDVDEWLTGGGNVDGAPAVNGAAETRVVAINETDSIDINSVLNDVKPDDASPTKTMPAVAASKNSGADTRDAANQALSKFFKRR